MLPCKIEQLKTTAQCNKNASQQFLVANQALDGVFGVMFQASWIRKNPVDLHGPVATSKFARTFINLS
jgi:hypothetical protein